MVVLQPKNLEEEERKFFESGCTYNPQFEYENLALVKKKLAQYKKPRIHLKHLALRIINAFLIEYGSESEFL